MHANDAVMITSAYSAVLARLTATFAARPNNSRIEPGPLDCLELVVKDLERKAADGNSGKNSADSDPRLKGDLKAAKKAMKHLSVVENATMIEKERKLAKLLADKELELTHARQVNETLQQQNHALKSKAERAKEERKASKSQVKSIDELRQELEKARQECEKAEANVSELREATGHMQATEEEFKRKDMENRDIIRRLQRHNTEYDAKLRKLEERKESLEKELTDKRVENSGLLAQLLDAIQALSEEEESHRNAQQSVSGTTRNAVESTQIHTLPSAAHSELLEAFKNGVYATLTGSGDGYTDMRTLLAHLREDIGVDGESKAREFGFQSLEAFLRSTAMQERVLVGDAEGGTVYKARPNATNRHQHEASVISAEAAARRRDRRAFFDARERMQLAVDDERSRANAL
ncbi:hypothetical protein AAVH_34890 [Aphelenchoides avenae]|nr:hypothetical protein AAVH_34890 [Aphelenchus avenae]